MKTNFIAGSKNSCERLAIYYATDCGEIWYSTSRFKSKLFLKYKRTVNSSIYYQTDENKIMYVNCNL